MIEREWTQFTRTGRVEDYLAYSKVHETAVVNKAQDVKERKEQNGAEHCAYRDGAISHTHRGL